MYTKTRFSVEPDWNNPNTWFINTYTSVASVEDRIERGGKLEPKARAAPRNTTQHDGNHVSKPVVNESEPHISSGNMTLASKIEHIAKLRLDTYRSSSSVNASSVNGIWPPDSWLRVFHPMPLGHRAIKEAIIQVMVSRHRPTTGIKASSIWLKLSYHLQCIQYTLLGVRWL